MSQARFRHELRLLGWANFGLPLLVVAIYIGFSAIVWHAALS